MTKAGIRDLVSTISPTWLRTGVAEKFLYNLGLAADAMLEKLNQGVRDHIPGQGDPSALPFIGADRLIGQGLGEPAPSYAARLTLAFDDWAHAGSARSVLRQVMAFFYLPQPRARYVSQYSAWDEYQPTDNTSTTAPRHQLSPYSNWRWDNLASPVVTQGWWRRWLILYSTANTSYTPVAITGATNGTPIVITTSTPHGLATGAAAVVSGVVGNTAANGTWAVNVVSATTLALQWSTGNGAYISGGTLSGTILAPAPPIGTAGLKIGDPNNAMSIGFNALPAVGASMRQIAKLWKSANTWLLWFIVSFDDTLFDASKPALSAGLPDGTWGRWSKEVNGVRVPARAAAARYIDGVI